MGKPDLELVARLEEKAVDIRKQLIEMTYAIGHAHLGGSLSLCDAAVALYYHFLRFDPQNLKDPDRDRLILSKGHCGCLFYNIFADLGMYTKEELYNGYNRIGGRFGQHPNRKYIEGFEASTGSLGHGLSLAVGFAFSGRMDRANWRVYCITGDGELNEGSNWEAIMFAGHHRFGNLVAIVDRNKIQGNGWTEETVRLEPLADKWEAFGWDVINVEDGNDMEQIVDVLGSLPPVDPVTPRRPICIILNTVKGKGVAFMENEPKWHAGGLSAEKKDECLRLIEQSRKVRR
ncbi:MAG: transketolase [Bacillota bacterium]|jgi:transketolase|nr:transketolase [Bacillota bacterium]HHU30106.1 transketolase [Bacillota bacterium]